MKSKKKKKLLLLLVLLLGLTVGFALLSTTLKINGTAGVKGNTWDVRWDDESVDVAQGSVSAEDPEVEGTNDDTVTFSVNLELPGDYYEFTVDAVNKGTIDAIITDIRTTIKDADSTSQTYNQEVSLPSYIHFTVTYGDGVPVEVGHRLAKRVDATHPTAQTYKVRVEYDPLAEVTPESDLAYKIEYEVDYGQASKKLYTYKTRQVDNAITAGDEICVGDECFNVLSSDSTTTVLLAENNLNTTTNRQATTNASTSAFYTTTGDSYWKNKVGTDYPGSYADPSYPTVYDSNSDIYAITQKYANSLVKQGLPVSASRQLSYTEVKALCSGLDCSSNNMITTGQAFYLGEAYDDSNVWSVTTAGAVSSLTIAGPAGVRPVVSIPTSFLS